MDRLCAKHCLKKKEEKNTAVVEENVMDPLIDHAVGGVQVVKCVV